MLRAARRTCQTSTRHPDEHPVLGLVILWAEVVRHRARESVVHPPNAWLLNRSGMAGSDTELPGAPVSVLSELPATTVAPPAGLGGTARGPSGTSLPIPTR